MSYCPYVNFSVFICLLVLYYFLSFGHFNFFSSRLLPFLICLVMVYQTLLLFVHDTCDLGPLRGKVKDDGGGPFDNQCEAAS
jgi:hypothetical protein